MTVRVGKPIVEKPLFAPIVNTPCVYYVHSEEAECWGLEQNKPRKFDWIELEKKEEALPEFKLQHNTGTLTVQTKGASFNAPIVFEQKHAVPKTRLKSFPEIDRYTGYSRTIVRALVVDKPIQFNGYYRESNGIALVTRAQGMKLSAVSVEKKKDLFEYLHELKPKGLLPEY